MGGVGAPDEKTGSVLGGSRVEADDGVPEQEAPGDVAREIADRVGFDLGRAEAVKEAHRKEVREE